MKKRKVKRYDEGGKTEEDYKKEGLASSKGEKVGFLERLRMGNIDDPKSEAYYKFGAGRAKMAEESKTPVPEMSSDYSGKGTKTPEANVSSELMPKRKPVDIGFTGDDEEERTISKYIRTSPKEDAVEEKEEVTVKPKPKPKPKKKSLSGMFGSIDEEAIKQRGNAAAAFKSEKKEPSGPKTAAEARTGKRSTEQTSSGFGPKITYNTPEKLESARKSYYSGFESKPVRTSADIRAGRNMKAGGKVSSASSRADGIAQRGKTKGRIC